MRAGDLRKRITIEQPGRSADGAGEMIATWTTFATAWASIEPLQGSEKIQAQQVNANMTIKVTVRYVVGITAQMRIRTGTRTLQIAAPPQNVDERNREIVLLCTEQESA